MEDFLLVSALKVEVGLRIPPAAGTWARNDLLHWATNALPAIQKHSFLGYAASLPQMSGTTATPSSEPLQNKPPTAERN